VNAHTDVDAAKRCRKEKHKNTEINVVLECAERQREALPTSIIT
jgi:hypothetical protein